MTAEQPFDDLHRSIILLIFRLDQINDPAHLSVNVKLFRTVVNINQEHIVEQQVLNKIVLIESLLVSGDEILNLADCYPSEHIGILSGAFGYKNKFQRLFIINLEKMRILYNLTVRRRICELNDCLRKNKIRLHCRGYFISFRIHYGKVDPGNSM